MAKSNSADISDIMEYMASLIEEVTSGEQLKLFSAEMAKIMEEKILKGFQAADPNRLTQKELKEIKEFMKSSFSSMGMGTRMSSAVFEKFFKNLAQEIKAGNQVQMDRLTAVLSNLVSTMISTSEGAREGGTGKEYFKPTDDKTGKLMYEAIAKSMGVKLDEATYKILNMFSSYQQDQKKERRKFTDNLIEGLAANKFIGGAMNDTFRLVGFLGASVLKNIPLIGKFIAPVFYGVMQALGPILTQAVITGIVQGMTASIIGNLFSGLLGRLGGRALGQVGSNLLNKGAMIGWGSQLGEVAVKTAPYSAAMTGWGAAGMTAAQTEANIGANTVVQTGANTVAQTGAKAGLLRGALGTAGKVAGKVLPALGVLLEGGTAVSEWRKGNKGKASMHGASAALGTAAIVAGATGVGAPVALILGALSIITGLIGTFMKDSKRTARETGEYQSKMEDNVGAIKEKSWWENLFSTSWGTHGGGGNNDPYQPDRTEYKRLGNLSLGMSGEALNLRGMTPQQASKYAQRYMKEDSQSYYSIYTNLGSKYASLQDYKNDWAIRDSLGRATAAVSFKGSEKYLENIWDTLGAGGVRNAKGLKFSSGVSTATSPHKKGGFSSHDNPFALTHDLANANWTDQDWKKAVETLQGPMAQQGWVMKYEGVDKRGKTVYTDSFVPGLTNRHLHIYAKEGNKYIPTGGIKNQQRNYKQKLSTVTSNSMEINDILKAMPEKDKRTWAAERQKEGNAKKSNLQILEEMGYHHDKNMALSPYSIYKGEGDNKQYILDPTGNRNFRDKQITLSHCSQYGCDQIRD